MFVGLAVGLALEKMKLTGLCQLKSSKFALSRDFGKSYFRILLSSLSDLPISKCLFDLLCAITEITTEFWLSIVFKLQLQTFLKTTMTAAALNTSFRDKISIKVQDGRIPIVVRTELLRLPLGSSGKDIDAWRGFREESQIMRPGNHAVKLTYFIKKGRSRWTYEDILARGELNRKIDRFAIKWVFKWYQTIF